jgi:Protein of unknown function (DUF2786)
VALVAYAMAKRPAEDQPVTEEDIGAITQALLPRKRAARQRGPPTLPPPLYRASVNQVADSGAIANGGSAASELDNNIMQRIKKCLARAHHPGTPEAEAKAALFLASRLMGQYNVSQAEVLAHETSEARQQYAGQSIVAVQRTDEDTSKPVLHQGYVDILISAMNTFFDCACYTTKRSCAIDVTFYGIAQNTAAAAYSFEMVYNQINDWARAYKGGNPRNSYFLGASESLQTMARKEKKAEEARARRAEVEALVAKVREEQRERQAQLDRLAPLGDSAPLMHAKVENNVHVDIKRESDSSHSPLVSQDDSSDASDTDSMGYTGFDNGSDDSSSSSSETGSEDIVEPDFNFDNEDRIDPSKNLEDELQRLIKPDPEELKAPALWSVPLAGSETQLLAERMPAGNQPLKTEQPTTKTPEPEADEGPKWASHTQLVAFRDTAADIAEEYLKGTGLKLRQGVARGRNVRDAHAYGRGREDGKKIDVRRRRIAEES